MAEQNQRRQAVQEQVALAEQREERQAEERRVEVKREKWEQVVQKQVELAGERERDQREQGEEARMWEKELTDDPIMMREEDIRRRLNERGPYPSWPR